jgi:peptide/nickel transport system ATP-binding protein
VVRAVDGVDFDVLKGETLGVVGESGCGKSTTARLLMQLIEPDARRGGVRRPRSRRPRLPLKEYRRQVQMVFQDSYASLNPRLTIEDSIAFGPQVHGVSRRESVARARDLLARVGWRRSALPNAIRMSCRAASASASTSRARWRCSRAW